MPIVESDTAVPVLVLKIGRYALHHGTVGIIRSLGRMGVPVYSVVEDQFTPAAVSRYLTGAFIWNTLGLDTQNLLDGMAIIGKRLKRRTIVVPTDDVAAIFVAEQAPKLKRWFVFPEQPATLPRILANKRELYLLCKLSGVPCPEVFVPTSMDEVHAFVEGATFPVVVKAAESWLLSAGRRTTSIAWTAEQAYSLYRDVDSQQRPNVILQEYVPDGEDWFYHGYRNSQTDCSIGFTGIKMRSYPCFAGPTTLGKAVANDLLLHQAEALLALLSYSGIADLDYRLDKRDGQYKLLDFNPRIGAQFRVFEDLAGIDVVRALYLDLNGKRLPGSRQPKTRTFIVELHDFAASITYLKRHALSVNEWWKSLQGTRELAWFSADDPLPFLTMCVRLLLRVARRMLRMTSRRTSVNQMPRFESNWRTGFRYGTRTSVRGMRAIFSGLRDESRIFPGETTAGSDSQSAQQENDGATKTTCETTGR